MNEEVMLGNNDGSILVNTIIKENENPNFDCHEETLPLLHSRVVLDQAECKYEYGHWLWEEQSVESCSKNSLLLQKTREIAGLRRELELITKLLSTSHENEDVEALEGKKRANQLFCKHSESSVGSVTLTPEKLEDLRQLSREQLIKHFETDMNMLKREHDYTIQEMTEEYFSIKRRCLNLEECGSYSSLKTDKGFFDVLRKKLPDIILRLDKVLLEGEKSFVFEGMNDADIKNQLDSLLRENCQLKDSLLEAGKKISKLSQVEENHRNLISKLEDSHAEASVHEYCAVIYKEAFKEADKKLGELKMNVSEKEQALRSEVLEKEILQEEIHLLECHVKEKEDLLQIQENDLATKEEKLEIAFQQINSLQYQIEQQAIVIEDKEKEVKAVSARALEKSEGYEMEISELEQKLELARNNMKITEHEKVKSELKLSSIEAEQKRLKNQFVSTVLSLSKWSKDFENLECMVEEKTIKTSSRLKSMQSQLSDLLDEVDELKTRETIFKQLMEKKTCNLQKAETEVDLLGNEIESLMDLLKKIYIALDHYSPVLKHYPGIIEILKLVRRELRGESKRLSVF
ncbi:PREDICTED: WPP domain-associated protein-like [Camelina sativa]|uniref:WPP domain-associated protein-like n=1 Tax=Camelina sativa TaxID=90675 RepID=A0ABM0VTG1_CAMSA|nr:PREDICTED: WPP domain-associated protein-like [Camelina sativa]